MSCNLRAFSLLAAKRRYTLKSPALAFLKLNMYGQSIGDNIISSCQSSDMAALLNSLSFTVTNSFLPPKYRVKYYYYIVKWCSGI